MENCRSSKLSGSLIYVGTTSFAKNQPFNSHERLRKNFLLTILIHTSTRVMRTKRKTQLGNYRLIQYQILQIDIISILWQTVRIITNEILRVKRLSPSRFASHIPWMLPFFTGIFYRSQCFMNTFLLKFTNPKQGLGWELDVLTFIVTMRPIAASERTSSDAVPFLF